MKQGALIFNELTDRYDIRVDLADYYGGLHCGECLEVFTGGKWKPTRIEYGDNWYLVGTRFLCLLRMFFPTSYYGGKRLFAKAGQKKNAAIFIKGCNALSYLFSFLVRLLQSLSPLRLQSVSPYRSYRQAARRAAAVASFSRGCLIREKELVYGYVITGYKLIEDLQARLLPFVLNVRKIAWGNVHFVAYFLAALIPACPRRFYRLPESCKVI